MSTYTREHLRIDYGTMEWGAPTAIVYVEHPEERLHYGRTVWQLASTKGMPPFGKPDREDGRYLLHRLDGHRRRIHPEGDPDAPLNPNKFAGGDWHGSYPSADLETCIKYLVESLNEWEVEEADRWQIGDALYTLRTALGAFEDMDTPKQTKRLRDRWSEIRALVLAVEMVLFRDGEGASNGEGTEPA